MVAEVGDGPFGRVTDGVLPSKRDAAVGGRQGVPVLNAVGVFNLYLKPSERGVVVGVKIDYGVVGIARPRFAIPCI